MHRKPENFFIALFLLAMSATQLNAHPGHGQTDGFSPWHFIMEPVHLIPTFIVAAVVVIVGVLLWRKRKER